jgi:hypothetical protein
MMATITYDEQGGLPRTTINLNPDAKDEEIERLRRELYDEREWRKVWEQQTENAQELWREKIWECKTARQSRGRLVQLVRSLGEIRKTLGNVARLGRERDEIRQDATAMAEALAQLTHTDRDELVNRVLIEHAAKYLEVK